ncbi:MAG TPA: serine hydrolase, partial [Firmicutes bacterium]|nr:serine hydrolase [Bacillota bacterium]
HYQYAGETKSITQFVEHTDTTGLIVTSGDVILYEEYFQGNAAMSRSIVWSVSKSVVSALMGIAIADGYIKDVS